VWPTNTAPVAYYDGSRQLPDGSPAHAARDAVHRLHATQDVAPGTPFRAVAREHMQVPLVRLADIDPTEDHCTARGIAHPTWDIPGNRAKFLERIERARSTIKGPPRGDFNVRAGGNQLPLRAEAVVAYGRSR